MNYGNYTNFWNDIQVNNTSFTDDVDTKPKVDHIALAGYRRAIGLLHRRKSCNYWF